MHCISLGREGHNLDYIEYFIEPIIECCFSNQFFYVRKRKADVLISRQLSLQEAGPYVKIEHKSCMSEYERQHLMEETR